MRAEQPSSLTMHDTQGTHHWGKKSSCHKQRPQAHRTESGVIPRWNSRIALSSALTVERTLSGLPESRSFFMTRDSRTNPRDASHASRPRTNASPPSPPHRHQACASVSKSPFNARNVDSKRQYPFTLRRVAQSIVAHVFSPVVLLKAFKCSDE
jgi:hypothetical protein